MSNFWDGFNGFLQGMRDSFYHFRNKSLECEMKGVLHEEYMVIQRYRNITHEWINENADILTEIDWKMISKYADFSHFDMEFIEKFRCEWHLECLFKNVTFHCLIKNKI